MPDPLSPAEQRVILSMRQLRPYERIEIRFDDNKPDRMAIVISSTVKEVFQTAAPSA